MHRIERVWAVAHPSVEIAVARAVALSPRQVVLAAAVCSLATVGSVAIADATLGWWATLAVGLLAAGPGGLAGAAWGWLLGRGAVTLADRAPPLPF